MDVLRFRIDGRFAGMTPAEFLSDFALAKAKASRIFRLGAFLVNGRPADPAATLVKGDVVTIDLRPFEGLDFVPEYGDVAVLYEDDSVLVVDKPAGIIVHPDDKAKTGTLVNLVAGHFERQGLDRRVGYLHRLDRDTTGCLLVAKDFLAHAKLASQWDHETVTRSYLALVSGRFRDASGTVDLPLGRDRHVAGRHRVHPDGERAVTRYRVLRQYDGYAAVALTLLTGKTHQIRAHMAHLGHPLLGDSLYGGETAGIARTALHAETIAFPHPMTGEKIEVIAPLPYDIARLM
ncbi:MAG: RluA family pseudouridine synthase [Candidatus Izemoplasmatales bacterium]